MRTTRRATVASFIVLPALAACGGEAARPEPTKPAMAAAPTKPAAVEPTKPAAVEPTKAPTAAAIKIGLVTHAGGRVDDKAYNEAAWTGARAGATAVNGEAKYLETGDPNDHRKNVEALVGEKHDIIVTVGAILAEATTAVAKANPGVRFIGIDQMQSQVLPNVAGLVFDEDRAGFLAGALAGLYSKAGKVGAVMATDVVPIVWRFGEGFRAGARHVRPNIDVQLVYHSDVGPERSFDDPEWGKATALSMIDRGADVVFGEGGRTGNGALYAAAARQEKGVVAIGGDSDQYATVVEARSVLLSSATKSIDTGVADLIKAVVNKSFAGGNVTGKVGLAPFHDLQAKVDASIISTLETIQKQLEAGTLKTNVAPMKG